MSMKSVSLWNPAISHSISRWFCKRTVCGRSASMIFVIAAQVCYTQTVSAWKKFRNGWGTVIFRPPQTFTRTWISTQRLRLPMRFWVYIPPHDALCPSNVPPKISLKTANLLMREGQYIRVQSIKKSPQTQSYQGFASLQGVVPVAGVEPARYRYHWILSFKRYSVHRRIDRLSGD